MLWCQNWILNFLDDQICSKQTGKYRLVWLWFIGHCSLPLAEPAAYTSNVGSEGSFTISGTFHLKGRGYSGGGLIWCFDALFDDGQHKVEKASVMCLHWGTWKESPGPRARGECCRWIWGLPPSRTVAPLMPHNPFSVTFIFLKSATPSQLRVWFNLWWMWKAVISYFPLPWDGMSN